MTNNSDDLDRSRHSNNRPRRLSRRAAFARMVQGVAGLAVASAATGRAKAGQAEGQVSEIAGRMRSEWTPSKQTAFHDYQCSMARFGGRLTSDSQRLLQPQSKGLFHYDVVVIGSGYGASICAARLAAKLRPNSKLCILERGKEWIPGTYPDTFRNAIQEGRQSIFGLDKKKIRRPLGLLNLHQFDDITVFTGSGLGGGSLINANVVIRPDHEVFLQHPWPKYLSDRRLLEPYFDRAEWELGTTREPIDMTYKMKAQRLAAEQLADCGAHFEASALTITRGCHPTLPILNRQGIIQRPCTSCGDCMTGCNVGAKNSLNMNYLPLARRHGADIFSQTEVDRIEKCQDHYVVSYTHHLADSNGETCPIQGSLRARLVILGAGCLGSTELLLRSQCSSMQFSSRLGCAFSGNGDILGVIRGTTIPTGIDGVGAYQKNQAIGPTIESNVTYPHRPNLYQRVVIQEGVAARAYSNAMMLFGRDVSLEKTQVLLVSGHDGALGKIELDETGRAVVRWPDLYHHPYRKFAESEIRRFASALGGEYREMVAFKGRVGTVHPLGGCGMADDPAAGVTDHRGRVFDGRGGGYMDRASGAPAVHDGLYVADGAVFPTSLGVNPLATISALAERTAEYITIDPQYADLFQIG